MAADENAAKKSNLSKVHEGMKKSDCRPANDSQPEQRLNRNAEKCTHAKFVVGRSVGRKMIQP